MDVDTATQTMIDNLPGRTGRTLEQWFEILDGAHLDRHGQAVSFLKSRHGVTHGFANLIVTRHRARGEAPPSASELVDAQYAGAKAGLRPVLDRILAAVGSFGADVEVAPKKTGVSLRRHKQFALVEVPSTRRVSLGLNLPGEAPTGRLEQVGGMCTHRVDLTQEKDVDDEVVAWLRDAYARA